MRPVRALLGDARWIFLAPDGALALVPPGALMDEEGHWLIERFAFVDLTSGRDLLHFSRAPTRAPSAPLLLGNPAFGPIGGMKATARAADAQADDVRGRRSVDMTMVQFGALPGTAAETLAIARLLPDARALLGEEATEAAVKRARGPRVLHLATHGFFLPDASAEHPPALGDMPRAGYAENPLLRAGLALAGANARASGDDDGILTALEVSALDLGATRLVVLSACETGLGDVQRGEGVLGLRRAFLLAGAETLVTSLWKVDDRATRELMIAYHERLRRGEGRAEALRRAQLLLHQQSATAHPYFWAAFVASGSPASLDGRLTPPALPRVGPGLRGCGCSAAGAEGSGHGATVLAAIGAMALLRGRRLRRA
jgi:CHAT domain-containing protein